jgi:PAS domain S-box-containing protein
VPAAVRFAAVAGVYFLASLIGTRFVVRPENLSVFWPAGGLLLGYLLVADRRHWLAAVAAAVVGNVAGNLWHGHTPAVSVGFAAINAVEPLAAAWLAVRVGGPLRLDRVPDVFRLFASPLAVCAATALAGAWLVTAGLGAPSFWGVWKAWWLGDALGAILFAPPVVAWAVSGERWRPRRATEFATALAALAALVWAVFVSGLGERYAPLAIAYPVFPLLLWVTLRSDLRGTAAAVVLTALVAAWGTLAGRGPFGELPASAAEKVLITQGFVATVCLSSLVLSAALRERRAAEDELRGQRQLLRAILDSMGEAVLVGDAGGRVLLANAAFERLHPGAAAAAPPGEWPAALGLYLPDGRTPCPPDRLPVFRAARGEACDDVRLVVVNAVHPDGAHVSVTGRPVVGGGGVVGGVVTIRDVTPTVRAEAALRASEERFAAIFHSQFQFIGLMSPAGVLLEANRTSLAAAGAGEADVLGRPFWETPWWAHDPAQQERLKAAVRRAAGGERDRFEASHPTAGGGLMWVDFSLTPFRDATGAVALLIPEGRDITERKRIEAALRLSEEQFRSAFEHAPIGMALVAPDGRWLRVNRSVCALVGYSEAELLAIDFQTTTHPGDLGADLEHVRQVLTGAIPTYQMEKRYVHKGGHVVHALLSVSLVRDADGGPLYFIAQIKDITERKAAEERLRESRTLLSLALEAGQAGVWYLDVAPRRFVPSARALELHGLPPDATLNHDEGMARVHPDDRGRVGEALGRTLGGGEPYRVEYRVAGDGEPRWLASFADVRPGPDGPRLVGLVQDVTARRRAEDRVRASLREKEVLLKEIHHRVKNNLQIVSTLLDLQSDYTADPGALEMFRESRGRVKSMALVHERLYRSADVARVDFAEYVRQLAHDLYRAYRVSDQDVRLELDVAAPPLPIDIAIPCGLLLNELMSNCFKHAFGGAAAGAIRVALRGEGAANVLSVADDGAGFPAGVDFRNPASFGLQLVNTLAEQLGGTVEMTTGRGTAFTVRFPGGK